ncbi:MAG: Smr/MutS family protein [Acholeplasmatales bacterium]|jgi:DNA mismatch repair protein MutS2|nr:Smr/MutS family protein [Acholeplasmatales bacterium]
MEDLLEFEKIILEIRKYAVSDAIKDKISHLKPLKFQDIKNELIETDCLSKLKYLYSFLPINEEYDISYQIRILELNGFLSIDNLLFVRSFFYLISSLFNYSNELKRNNVNSLINDLYLAKLTNTNFLLDYLNLILDYSGNVLDSASKDLLNIRTSISNQTKIIKEKASELLIRYQSHLVENLIVEKNGKVCLPVNISSKNTVKGTICDISSSGQTVYIEPTILGNIQKTIDELKIKEEKEIEKILYQVSSYLTNNIPFLISNLNIIFRLDFLQAKAKYAVHINGYLPKINNQGLYHLEGARCPLIENERVVPIDIDLDAKEPFILITGPNTGGKTVLLKTIGLITLMASSGILVPCSERSNVAIFDNILIDIGDGESIENSLSTFSSHMKRIINFLNIYSSNSLILIDEIGSGTDPSEGVALSKVIIKEFLKKNVRMVITTHYSELKTFVLEEKLGILSGVAFNSLTYQPEYVVIKGLGGKSQAINIAKNLGLPEHLYNEAFFLYESGKSRTERALDELDIDRLKLLEDTKRVNILEKELKDLKESYDTKIRELFEYEKELERKVTEKEYLKFREKEENINKLIEDLKQRNLIDIKEISEIKKELKELNYVPENTISISSKIVVGDRVKVINTNQIGIVKEIKRNKATIKIGEMSLYSSLDNLVKSNETRKKIVNYKPIDIDKEIYSANFEIDLRGKRYEEVYSILESAVSDAIMAHLHFIRVINGYGTLAVKKAVDNFVSTSNYVKRAESGGKSGGDGVTVLYLK